MWVHYDSTRWKNEYEQELTNLKSFKTPHKFSLNYDR